MRTAASLTVLVYESDEHWQGLCRSNLARAGIKNHDFSAGLTEQADLVLIGPKAADNLVASTYMVRSSGYRGRIAVLGEERHRPASRKAAIDFVHTSEICRLGRSITELLPTPRVGIGAGHGV